MAGAAWTNQVQNRVIVGGANGRILVYSGTPGPNNLIYSIAGAAGTDPYGNQYLAGATGYGLISGNFVAVQIFQGSVNLYDGSVLGSESGAWTAGGTMGGNLGVVALDTAVSFTTPMQFLLSDGNMLLSAPSATGAYTGLHFNPGVGLVAQFNGVDEGWNLMASLSNGWAAVAGNVANQYRLTAAPAPEVEIIGVLNAAAASAATFFTLPAGYRPAHAQPVCAMGASGSVPAGLSPWIKCDASGNLSVQNTGAVPAAWQAFYHGFVSLDA